MSTLTVQTISNGSVSTSSTNVIQGSGRAWVNWSGITGSIRASYNVSSITRSSAGVYSINFTNAFSDTNYCTVGLASGFAPSNTTTTALQLRPANSGSGSSCGTMGSNKSTTAISVQFGNVSSAMLDPDDCNVTCYR